MSFWKVIMSPGAALFKAATGRDVFAKKEDGAIEYVNTRLSIRPENFSGSLANLEALKSSETDSCAAFVKQKGVLVGAAARDVCRNQIDAAYANVLIPLQAEAYNQEQQVIDEFLQGNNNMLLIGLVAVVIILYVLYK